MRAVRLHSWNSQPELVEIATPTPGAGDVLLRVDAAGLCHSDLHLMEWPEGTVPYRLPFTLGHETAGTVVALGPGTSGIAVGDRVVVHARWGCGRCWPCLGGMENRCERSAGELGGHGGGVGYDGGLADYMLVPAVRYLVDIGDLDAAFAAPLTDAALTPYHAIKRCAHQLMPGTTAVVIGVGGIGHMAIQLLAALSSVRIVAVDVRDDALALARTAGADLAVAAADLTPEQLRAEVGNRGAGVVLDCVASDSTLALAAAHRLDRGRHLLHRARRRDARGESRAAAVRMLGGAPELGNASRASRGGRARQIRRDPCRGRADKPRADRRVVREAQARRTPRSCGCCP